MIGPAGLLLLGNVPPIWEIEFYGGGWKKKKK